MKDSVTKEEMLKEARSLLGMLYTDMGEPDFTARFLPHWRARIAAFMEGREPTYDPKTVPEQPSEKELPYVEWIEVSESTLLLRLNRMLAKDLRRNYEVSGFARIEHGEYPKWVLRLRKRYNPWQTR